MKNTILQKSGESMRTEEAHDWANINSEEQIYFEGFIDLLAELLIRYDEESVVYTDDAA